MTEFKMDSDIPGTAGGKLVPSKGHSGTFKAVKPAKVAKPKKATVKKTPKKAVKKPAAKQAHMKDVKKPPAKKFPAKEAAK